MNEKSILLPTAQNTIPVRDDLKLALFFGLLGALATAALFPYLLQVMPQLLAKVPASIPLPVLIAAQTAQAGILLSIVSFLGLRMSHRVALDAPWIRALLARRERPRLAWPSSILIGVSAALLVVGLDLLFAAHMPPLLVAHSLETPASTAWAGFLASFYGGIGEELQLRLFMMTLLVWLMTLVTKTPKPGLYWIAIFLAAILFGAGHLPAAAQMWPLDAVVVARTIILNALAGIAFGWLYWRRGLEMAMLAHFSADLVLHVFTPLFSF